jgi:hypothetical protein
MAFGGKGALWVQTGDQVRNPYYGREAGMHSCGVEQEKLEPGKPDGGGADG